MIQTEEGNIILEPKEYEVARAFASMHEGKNLKELPVIGEYLGFPVVINSDMSAKSKCYIPKKKKSHIPKFPKQK